MTAEVAQDQHWRRGQLCAARRASASSALVGRLGMAVTATLEGAMIVLFNPWSTPSPKKPLPMSLLALGSMLEGEFDYRIVDGNIEADPVGAILAIAAKTAADRDCRHGDAGPAAAGGGDRAAGS